MHPPFSYLPLFFIPIAGLVISHGRIPLLLSRSKAASVSELRNAFYGNPCSCSIASSLWYVSDELVGEKISGLVPVN
jgi:hypothetical protein